MYQRSTYRVIKNKSVSAFEGSCSTRLPLRTYVPSFHIRDINERTDGCFTIRYVRTNVRRNYEPPEYLKKYFVLRERTNVRTYYGRVNVMIE